MSLQHRNVSLQDDYMYTSKCALNDDTPAHFDVVQHNVNILGEISSNTIKRVVLSFAHTLSCVLGLAHTTMKTTTLPHNNIIPPHLLLHSIYREGEITPHHHHPHSHVWVPLWHTRGRDLMMLGKKSTCFCYPCVCARYNATQHQPNPFYTLLYAITWDHDDKCLVWWIGAKGASLIPP